MVTYPRHRSELFQGPMARRRRDVGLVALTVIVCIGIVGHNLRSPFDDGSPLLVALLHSVQLVETYAPSRLRAGGLRWQDERALDRELTTSTIAGPANTSRPVASDYKAKLHRKHALLVESSRSPRTGDNMTAFFEAVRLRLAARAASGLAARNTKECRQTRDYGRFAWFAVSPRKDFDGFVSQELWECV